MNTRDTKPRLALATGLITIFLFALITYGTLHGSLASIDAWAESLVLEWRADGTNATFLFLTSLGNWQTIVGLGTVAIAIYLFQKRRDEIFLLILAVMTGKVAEIAFKYLTNRNRPTDILPLIIADGYSFPSGHATTATVFYGLVGFLFWNRLRKRWQRALTGILAPTIILGIGCSRVFLGVHRFSDVLAGFFLGLFILSLSITVFQRIRPI